jgi:hypothetical protein
MEHDTVSREYFVEAILDGDADSFLKSISDAITKRREAINAKKLYMLSPGDTVRFNHLVRPKYLEGLTAEVVKTNTKRIVVKFTDGDSRLKAGRFGYGDFTTPVSLVDKVEA